MDNPCHRCRHQQPYYVQWLARLSKKRIADFMSEKPSYHVQQSIIAIGSGGLTGKERNEATQTHLNFYPLPPVIFPKSPEGGLKDKLFENYIVKIKTINAILSPPSGDLGSLKLLQL